MRMLTTDEYNHLMRNWSVLKDQISDAKNQRRYYHDKAQSYKDLIDRLELEEELYNNYMSGAIEEYEEAHPPEEPPE